MRLPPRLHWLPVYLVILPSWVFAQVDRDDPAQRLNETIQQAERLVERNAEDSAARIVLGRLYVRRAATVMSRADYGRAEAQFKAVLKADSENIEAQSQLTAVLLAQGRVSEARDMARTVLIYAPAAHATRRVMADALFAMGEYDKAEVELQRLVADAPDPAIDVRLAEMAWIRGDAIAAADGFRNALAAAKKNGSTGSALGWFHLKLGENMFSGGAIDDAGKAFDAALSAWPQSIPAMVGKARVLAAEEKLADAAELYAAAYGRSPEIQIGAEHLQVLLTLGDRDGSAKLFQSLLEQCEKSIGSFDQRREIAMFYADHGVNLDVAMELARADLTIRKDIHAYDVLAWVMYKRGLYEPAAATIELALREKTPDALIHFHAGLIRFALDDKAGALKHLQQAIDINPHFSLLHAPAARQGVAVLKAELERQP